MIGVFDSGLGGLTVVKEIERQLPGHGVVYLGDTARTPYGNKSAATVVRYSLQDADFLVRQGAKLIIVACNTASAVAIEPLRQHLSVPVLEVITPAATAAARLTHGSIGVIGTRATVGSGVYSRHLAKLQPAAKVISVACPLFVPLVEEGWANHPETVVIAERYLRSLNARHIDTLILGCTHYPFLKRAISEVMGPRVRLVDSAAATVAHLKRLVQDDSALTRQLATARRRASRFYVTDRTDNFERLASRWMGRPLRLQKAKIE